MNLLKQTLFLIFSTLILISSGCQSMRSHRPKLAQSAILFIGDGMGIAQMLAGRLYKGGSFYKMNYENFEITGFSKTYSSNNYTTDSAAGATALASGVKSYNGSIGMSDPRWEEGGKSRSLQTLADLAKAQGKSVGIITTTRITHATPACFYAHVPHRDSEADIAQQMINSNVDLWMGGGRKFFLPQSEGGKRKDGLHLIKRLKEKGKIVIESKEEFKNIKDLKRPVLALLGDDHIGYYQTGKAEVRLIEMVKKSIELLSQNPKGYFLMVEGGRIDHAAHINDPLKMMTEMTELDHAIGYAMNKVDLDKTLLVLTADHETAGLAISGYGPHKNATQKNILTLKTLPLKKEEKSRPIMTFATGPGQALFPLRMAAHSAVDVPIGAIGPSAYRFSGWMDNTAIAWNIARSMGMSFNLDSNLHSQKKLREIQKKVRTPRAKN